MITQAPRGVEDWYGERMHKRAYVERIARELARTYHMTEIITPMFEHTVLFQRGVGETTDVVQKEMYTFYGQGGSKHYPEAGGNGRRDARLSGAQYVCESGSSQAVLCNPGVPL